MNFYISVAGEPSSQKIYSELKKLTKGRVVGFMEFLKTYPNILKMVLQKQKHWYRDEILEMINEKEILKFKALLKDDKSLGLLENIVNFRKTTDLKFHPIPDFTAQYFPHEINLMNFFDNINFIDGGAFTGDTLSVCINELKKYKNQSLI